MWAEIFPDLRLGLGRVRFRVRLRIVLIRASVQGLQRTRPSVCGHMARWSVSKLVKVT